MHAKLMPVAEEVFLITQALNRANGGRFRWKDWKRAWEATSVRWRFAGFMSAGIALKTQVLHGTIVRISRGLYVFAQHGVKPVTPLYTPGRFRPYAS